MQEGGAIDKEKEIPALFFINIETPKQAAQESETPVETINLKETQTFVLIDLLTLCVSNDDPNIALVKEKNAKYIEASC